MLASCEFILNYVELARLGVDIITSMTSSRILHGFGHCVDEWKSVNVTKKENSDEDLFDVYDETKGEIVDVTTKFVVNKAQVLSDSETPQ